MNSHVTGEIRERYGYRTYSRPAERDTMDTLNGEWVMKGCGGNDPGRLRSPEDLLKLIGEIGFLPLFSNDIAGFSVEERTPAGDWWTDSPSDPWAWRQVLACSESAAYGKFFDKKAGFVSKEWFPDFANFRRDGYDWEGLYEDGKMKYRNRQILEALEPDALAVGLELLTCDLKKKAAVTKGFEGAVTELQMQTFLIMGGFRQKVNKQGAAYGWHVAVLMTPETKWGCDFVNGYTGRPEDAWNRIRGQVKRFFPDAGETEIRKVLGIRR